MRAELLTILLAGVASCYSWPESTAPVRQPTIVRAPPGRAWSAAAEVFAERSVPLERLERASDYAATGELAADGSAGWAYCGSDAVHGDVGPGHAVWNLRVEGDSAISTVLVTAAWWLFRGEAKRALIECATTGAWERQVEAQIKARAEASP